MRTIIEGMASRPQPYWRPVLAVLIYFVLAVAWMATSQAVEEAVSYDAWFLSLPVASIIVGLVVGRWWAIGLALIPALVTVGSWDGGCSGDDFCFGKVVFLLLVPLCAFGLGLGILLRRSWPEVLRGVRRAGQRAGSTIEERHGAEARREDPH